MLDTRQVDVTRLLQALGVDAIQDRDHWKMRCPSHREKTPSWFIRDSYGKPKNGVFYCFGCGYTGSAIDLVMDLEGITFPSAIQWIEERALGSPIPATKVVLQMSPVFKTAFRIPRECCFEPLEQWPSAPRRYLQERGVTAEQVSRWSIGYAVDGRLAGRIIIPIYDYSNTLRSYTARSYGDHEKRYKEPTAEEKADPSAIFGENAWACPTSRDIVVIVEGGFDALAIERVYPYLSFAGLYGSQVTPTHLAKLATFKRAIVFTDNDPAGDRAAEILMGGFTRHLSCKRVKAPEGVDANKMNPSALKELLAPCLHD